MVVRRIFLMRVLFGCASNFRRCGCSSRRVTSNGYRKFRRTCKSQCRCAWRSPSASARRRRGGCGLHPSRHDRRVPTRNRIATVVFIGKSLRCARRTKSPWNRFSRASPWCLGRQLKTSQTLSTSYAFKKRCHAGYGCRLARVLATFPRQRIASAPRGKCALQHRESTKAQPRVCHIDDLSSN